MNINLEHDTEIIADEILQVIMRNYTRPQYITENEKTAALYCETLSEKLEKDLSAKQNENLEKINSLKGHISAIEQIHDIFYGMKIQYVFSEFIKNPLKIIQFFDSKGETIKQKYNL